MGLGKDYSPKRMGLPCYVRRAYTPHLICSIRFFNVALSRLLPRSKKEYRAWSMLSLPVCFSGTMACILRGMIAALFAFTRHNVAYHRGAFCVGNLDGRLGFGFATALLRYGSAEIFFRTDSIRHLADTICIFDLHEHFAFGQVHPHTSHGRFCCKH